MSFIHGHWKKNYWIFSAIFPGPKVILSHRWYWDLLLLAISWRKDLGKWKSNVTITTILGLKLQFSAASFKKKKIKGANVWKDKEF